MMTLPQGERTDEAAAVNRAFSLATALSHYNRIVRFIVTLGNVPLTLLSLACQRLVPLHAINAGCNAVGNRLAPDTVSSPERIPSFEYAKITALLKRPRNRALLAALYRPSPVALPDHPSKRLACEFAAFLSLSGLSAAGIPAPLNVPVFQQLISIMLREGRMDSVHALSDAQWLACLRAHFPATWVSGPMIGRALLPLIAHLDYAFPLLGTALYNLASCNPLLIAFPYTLPARDVINAPVQHDAVLLRAFAPCFGPRTADARYRLAAFTTTPFQGHFHPCCAATPKANAETGYCEAGISCFGATIFAQTHLPTHQIVYAVVNNDSALWLSLSRQPILLPTMKKPLAALEAFPLLTRLFDPLGDAAVFRGPPLAHASLALSVPRAAPPAMSWFSLEALTRTLTLLPEVEARTQGYAYFHSPHFSWNLPLFSPAGVRRTPRKTDEQPLGALAQFFPDEYGYLAVTARFKPLMEKGGPARTVLQWVENMLDDRTLRFLLGDTTQAIPSGVKLFYQCAGIDTAVPQSWLISGFLKYILHLLHIDRLLHQDDTGEIYRLLGTFSPLDSSLSAALSRFIKPESGSDRVDDALRRIIVQLALPFSSAQGGQFTSHEMRGWKVMLGLGIAHFLPSTTPRQPMETADEFIHLLESNEQSQATRQRMLNLLEQPPLSFIIELMTLDVLHEHLIVDNRQKVIGLLSTFRHEERFRYGILAIVSKAVVERLYALEQIPTQSEQEESINIIRSSLITATAATLKFIVDNWFYQSSSNTLTVTTQRIIAMCWLKTTGRPFSSLSLFHGGVLTFAFDAARYFFFIDESGECAYLGANEQAAKAELLSNSKFYRNGNLPQVFLAQSGHRLNDIVGRLQLTFEATAKFEALNHLSMTVLFEKVAAQFVDSITFSTPRKNKLLGSTFSTRMQVWYSGISIATFIPLWGCYDSLQDARQDKIEKLIVCATEAPTVSLLAQQGSKLVKTLNTALYLAPQDLFSEFTRSPSSLRTLLMSPPTGVTLATDAPLAVIHNGQSLAAATTITRIHGASIESFSTLGSPESSRCYLGASAFEMGENLSVDPPVNRVLHSSASLGDVYSSLTTLRGSISVTHLPHSQSNQNGLTIEEEVRRFIGLMEGRVRERQRQSLQHGVQILAETLDELLANIPSLLMKKAELKTVLYSILLIASLETFKATLLALYNEEKHGGYQDTHINDFKLKFRGRDKLTLQLEDSKGRFRLQHVIPINETVAAQFAARGLVESSAIPEIRSDYIAPEKLDAFSFNRAVMQSLLAGLPFPAAPPVLHERATRTEAKNAVVSARLFYLRMLDLDASNFIALLAYLQRLDYPLAEVEVIDWQLPSTGSLYTARIVRLIEALGAEKNGQSRIIYPDFLAQPVQIALESYRRAGAADYVLETNRLHRLQYLRLFRENYLNFSPTQLEHYLLTNKDIVLATMPMTIVERDPISVTSANFAQVLARSQQQNSSFSHRPQFVFAQQTPADVAILLHQYLNASPEQRLAEIATVRHLNRHAGLGLGRVKSSVTPYYNLPPRLFIQSRTVRYGFAADTLPTLAFIQSGEGQYRKITLLEMLVERRRVDLQHSLLLRGNRMLTAELTDYLEASETQRQRENTDIALFYRLYRAEKPEYSLNATEFIVRIAVKYSAQNEITPESLIRVIDCYHIKDMTLVALLEDKTDNTLPAFPETWPQEACNELDCYRQTRFGQIIADC